MGHSPMRHKMRQQKSESPTVTHPVCHTLRDSLFSLWRYLFLLLVPGAIFNFAFTHLTLLTFLQAIIYEGQDKNPEMCRVLLTHEIMCR